MRVKLIIASMLWGMNILVMKEMSQYIPALLLANLRLCLTCLLLALLCVYQSKKIWFHFNKEFFYISFFSIFLNFVFTFLAINIVSGSTLASVNGLLPFATLLVSKEKWDKFYHTLSFIFVIISIVCTIESLYISYLFLLLSITSSAIGNVLIQRYHSEDDKFVFCLQYYLIGTIGISLLNMMLFDPMTITIPTIPIVNWIAFFVVSGIGFCYIQIVTISAINSIGSVTTGYYLSLNPVFTSLFALLFYQNITNHQIVSCLLLVFSIYFGSRKTVKINSK